MHKSYCLFSRVLISDTWVFHFEFNTKQQNLKEYKQTPCPEKGTTLFCCTQLLQI